MWWESPLMPIAVEVLYSETYFYFWAVQYGRKFLALFILIDAMYFTSIPSPGLIPSSVELINHYIGEVKKATSLILKIISPFLEKLHTYWLLPGGLWGPTFLGFMLYNFLESSQFPWNWLKPFFEHNWTLPSPLAQSCFLYLASCWFKRAHPNKYLQANFSESVSQRT